MEISPDGKTLRPRSQFAHLVNKTELQQMFRSFADVQTAEMLNLPGPAQGEKATVIACPMSAVQYDIQESLVARYEAIRSGKVKPWEDNALAITPPMVESSPSMHGFLLPMPKISPAQRSMPSSRTSLLSGWQPVPPAQRS